MKIERNSRHASALALSILVAAGCTTVDSTHLSPTAITALPPEQSTGVAYFLPKVRLHLRAEWIESKKEDAGPVTRPVPPKDPAPTASNQNSVSVNVTVNGEKQEEAKAGGGKTAEKFAIGDHYQVTIEPVFEPDPKQLYVLRHKTSGLSDDRLRVKTNPMGLLTSVNSTNTERSGEILVDLASIAIEGFKIAVGSPAGVHLNAMTTTNKNDRPKLVDITFDPTVAEELELARKALDKSNLEIHIRPDRYVPATATAGNDSNRQSARATADGVLYRPLLPYSLTISSGADTISRTILLPNEAPVLSYVPKRSLMVERVTDVTFENGILREAYVSKPSSVAAGVKVPLTILKSFAALPTELIQLKVNHNSAAKSLTDAQKAQIESLTALLAAQRAYGAAVSNSPAPAK